MKNQDGLFITFLYKTKIGRFFLKPFISKGFSSFMGKLMNCGISRIVIPFFVSKNKIDINEYQDRKYKSFNDFFIRKKKNGISICDDKNLLISPCDGKLTVFDIAENGIFNIKNSKYSLNSLLKDDDISRNYIGGKCLIFRLMPIHYHRYVFVDSGTVLKKKHIDGFYHCVRPTALDGFSVFSENTREYTVLKSENFGELIQMEVGAMSIGRITNYNENSCVFRGEEKGYFEFGGSTIIIMLKKDIAELNENIVKNSENGIETDVCIGESIGKIKTIR